MNPVETKQQWKTIGISVGGVAVVALLIWLLTWVFLDEPLSRIVAMVLIVGGLMVGIGNKKAFPGKHPVLLKWAVSVVFVLMAVWVQLPPRAEAEVEWTPYSEAAIEQAAKAGKPVIIDFYADWCPPCRDMDVRVFSRAEVAEELERFVKLRADVSDQSSRENARISERHSVSALPTVVFIGSDGQERLSMRLIGYEPAGKFSRRLRAIR